MQVHDESDADYPIALPIPAREMPSEVLWFRLLTFSAHIRVEARGGYTGAVFPTREKTQDKWAVKTVEQVTSLGSVRLAQCSPADFALERNCEGPLLRLEAPQFVFGKSEEQGAHAARTPS